MKELTADEIKFVKDTNFTPTTYQTDIYSGTSFKDFEEAAKTAKDEYNFKLSDFLKKNLEQDDSDGISLEYVATYLLYSFFDREDLEKISPKEALKWLQDYRYFCGFRKWDEDLVAQEIQEAIEVYDGVREFYLVANQVWNREKEER